MPGHQRRCEITHTYGREEAIAVINLSMLDYQSEFGALGNKLNQAAFEAILRGKKLSKSNYDESPEFEDV
jgi:hypothetical protein